MENNINNMENVEEIWKDIPGYEGYYQVSNLGSVRSLDRQVINKNYKGLGIEKIINRIGKIHESSDSHGYRLLHLHKEGKRKSYLVHQLVAMAFLNHKLNRKMVVDHIDNDKSNNNLSNLQIISQRKNVIKSIGNIKGYRSIKSRSGEVIGYQSSIWKNGKSINIGYYSTTEEASTAYQKKLNELI